jgi:hypothetical protein
MCLFWSPHSLPATGFFKWLSCARVTFGIASSSSPGMTIFLGHPTTLLSPSFKLPLRHFVLSNIHGKSTLVPFVFGIVGQPMHCNLIAEAMEVKQNKFHSFLSFDAKSNSANSSCMTSLYLFTQQPTKVPEHAAYWHASTSS